MLAQDPEQTPLSLPPQQPPSDLAHTVRQTGRFFNEILGRVAAKLDKGTQEIVAASSHALHPEPAVEPFYVSAKQRRQHAQIGPRLRRTARHAIVASREGSRRAKQHLKTPLGKVATIQTLAIVGLFAFVATQANGSGNLDESARSSADALGNVRQYLPVIKPGVDSTQFDEASFAATERAQDLHAWVTPWNIHTLGEVTGSYASLSAFWGTMGEDGSTIELKGNLDSWRALKTRLDPAVPTYFTISGNPNFTFTTLTNPDARSRFATNLIRLLKDEGFSGVDLDFEGLGSANREFFTDFVRSLSTTLKAEDLRLAVTLEARIANRVPMDWQAIGQIADEVRIMAYDYRARRTGEPGPVAPLGWVKEVADYAMTTIPAEKVVMGLGNYGYDWGEPVDSHSSWEGTGVSHGRALALAAEHNSPIVRASGIDPRGYDIGTIPSFEYRDANGTRHSVWFEDATSLQEKLNLLKQYPLRGVIFWSVGLGEKEVWTPTP